MHLSLSLRKPSKYASQAFLLALLAAVIMFLPFLIFDRGYFVYYGDFNVQQIPFYKMAHDAILSGNTHWSWTTDLGANFIGSYSFYLLGSPFFWITLLFPSAVVPYLMAPLLILKFALSSLAAYGLLQRFVRPNYAVIGGLLYAFSGFSMYNIFFNHFHEAIIYFPLMLLSMELYMKDGRRGFFAITVFLSALSNYYFFIGQAIFLMIYWLIRALSGDWKCTISKFLGLVFESIAGTAMASILLLPAYFAVIQNPRTDNILSGWNLLIYNKPQRFFDIIHSFFFPQDIPARSVFFPKSDNKWASMSAWIPVFGCSGVIAYFQSRKRTDWIRRLLSLCFIFALIPGLNAVFQLFNSIYYARWYYMMILILVLATVKAIDECDEVIVNWKRAFALAFGVTIALILFVGLIPKSWYPDKKAGKIIFGLYNHKYTELFWFVCAIALISLILAALLISIRQRQHDKFIHWAKGVTMCMIIIFGLYSIGAGKVEGNVSSNYVINRAIEGADKINIPDLDHSRVDFNKCMDNMGMFWQIPTIQAFHSIVPGSIMEFYPSVDVKRDVGSRPDSNHYALRGLLSVRWLFDYNNDDKTIFKKDESFFAHSDDNEKTTMKMPGWRYYDEQNDFMIYENEYYIPFGFTYDYYLTRKEYDSLAKSTRELSLLKAIVLEDKDVEKYSPYFYKFDGTSAFYNADFSQQGYLNDCEQRRKTAASSFKRDNHGFSATISMPQDNLVFFSVPYEDGWSATVNGKPAEIIHANVGFMAVLCPEGENVSIRFDYKTPGLQSGFFISLISLFALIIYLAIAKFLSYRKQTQLPLNINEPLANSNQSHDNALPPDGFDLYKYYPGTKTNKQNNTSNTVIPLKNSKDLQGNFLSCKDKEDSGLSPADDENAAGR